MLRRISIDLILLLSIFLASTRSSLIDAHKTSTSLNSSSTSQTSFHSSSAELMTLSLHNGSTSATNDRSPLPSAYVYRPPQVPLDVERYPMAPKGLDLEQVHIYVRHGERTPVGIRLSAPPASIPEHWVMCKTARRFRAAVLGDVIATDARRTLDDQAEGLLHTRKLVERPDGTSVEGDCLLGELTDIGRQSTYNYGAALRKLYIEKLNFLPDKLVNSNAVYFRSTNMPRTIESLQQVIHGLYPTSKCDPAAVPPLLLRNSKDENLYGNTYSCKRLELLQVAFAQAAASAFNHTLEPLDKKLSKYLGGNPIRVDGKPRASGILDTVRASIAHGVKVPPEFEEKAVIDVIEKAVVNEWFADKTEEVRRLGMGRLLSDLSHKMEKVAKAKINGQEEPKILVHSTHDTALAGLCSTLDVFDDKWPAFTASITFELFKTRQQQDADKKTFLQTVFGMRLPDPEYYVRMRYQNKNMILPLCADDGKHLEGFPEFCSLTAFSERVRELTPEDWDSECAPAGRV